MTLAGERLLTAALAEAMQSADELQLDRRRGQTNMFDIIEVNGDEVETLPDVPEWPDNEKLNYEKESLDFFLSSHPLAACEAEIKRFASHQVEQLRSMDPAQEVLVGGMLTQVRFMNTKRPGRNGHSRYVRCKLEDFTGIVECMMWPDEFVRYKDEFADDRIVFVKGAVEHRLEQPSLVLDPGIWLGNRSKGIDAQHDSHIAVDRIAARPARATRARIAEDSRLMRSLAECVGRGREASGVSRRRFVQSESGGRGRESIGNAARNGKSRVLGPMTHAALYFSNPSVARSPSQPSMLRRAHRFAQIHLRRAGLAVFENDRRLADAATGLMAAVEHFLLERIAPRTDAIEPRLAKFGDPIAAKRAAGIADRQAEKEPNEQID